MAKQKKLTKRELEKLQDTLAQVQGWKQEALEKFQELSDLQRKEWKAVQDLEDLTAQFEKKYGSVNIEIATGKIITDEQQVSSSDTEQVKPQG